MKGSPLHDETVGSVRGLASLDAVTTEPHAAERQTWDVLECPRFGRGEETAGHRSASPSIEEKEEVL